jgi:hypothetical protein
MAVRIQNKIIYLRTGSFTKRTAIKNGCIIKMDIKKDIFRVKNDNKNPDSGF